MVTLLDKLSEVQAEDSVRLLCAQAKHEIERQMYDAEHLRLKIEHLESALEDADPDSEGAWELVSRFINALLGVNKTWKEIADRDIYDALVAAATVAEIRLLTKQEAAEVIRLTPGQIGSLVSRGLIPIVRLPNNEVRFCPRQLRQWFEDCKHPKQAARTVLAHPNPTTPNRSCTIPTP